MLRGGEDEANYGLDLLDMVGTVSTKSEAVALGGRIRNELLKDERIESVDATVVTVQQGPVTILDVTVEAETREGPFALTIQVDELSAQLLNISTES
jgi:hypothetical protein